MRTAKRSPRSPAFDDLTPPLRELLGHDVPHDGPQIAVVWDRFLDTRDAADLQSLFNHYAPQIRLEAMRAKARRPELFDASLGELVSDGSVGLLLFLRGRDEYRPRMTRFWTANAIRSAIYGEPKARTWAGRKRSQAMNVLASIRATFIAGNGRVPTREELAQRLAEQVSNPNVYLPYADDEARDMIVRSQAEPQEKRAMAFAPDASAADPAQRMMDGQILRLAMKGLSGVDRQILRLLLKGFSPADIAARTGLPKRETRQRCNGVLWEARCRADLAKELGVEPANKLVLTIARMPPANLAAG